MNFGNSTVHIKEVYILSKENSWNSRSTLYRNVIACDITQIVSDIKKEKSVEEYLETGL